MMDKKNCVFLMLKHYSNNFRKTTLELYQFVTTINELNHEYEMLNVHSNLRLNNLIKLMMKGCTQLISTLNLLI